MPSEKNGSPLGSTNHHTPEGDWSTEIKHVLG
jgi:hypothetical protein